MRGLDAQPLSCDTAPVNSREVIRIIKKDGWYQVRQKGSHVHFQHPHKPGTATVPHPKKDLSRGTVKAIEAQTGCRIWPD